MRFLERSSFCCVENYLTAEEKLLYFYSMTLTQNEKGYPQPVTHVGIPKSIRDEKGWHWAPTHTAPVHYPWHKAPYLEKRKKELGKYIKELDPHKPVSII